MGKYDDARRFHIQALETLAGNVFLTSAEGLSWFVWRFLHPSWPTRKPKLKFNSNSTCCILAKLNINSTRANHGRNFFAKLILNNESYKDVNEDNICSLMHFFMQEAVLNGRPITFSKGMFVLYDSTKQFFHRLMMAKDAQIHGSEEHRSGYFKRLKHFALSSLKSVFQSKKLNESIPYAFIYVRGDESSHFRERGISQIHRKTIYPAYGMDVKHACMPNGFGHILFGKLRDLYGNESDPYYGDRIYIKPEEFGLQKFKHYIGHSGKYIQHISRRVLCKIQKFQRSALCSSDEAFRENTDTKLTKQWNQILSTIPILTENERNSMRSKVSREGIHEIYRQTSKYYNDYIQVRDFRNALENKYGHDTRSRKGNEIIFTTEQLLDSRISCEPITLSSNLNHHVQCPMQNKSTINSVFN
ncbi:unnamed protein product [Rotaria sp. Silwood2]|nr:unnamed protein product [Rotaria sp. Silwood2]